MIPTLKNCITNKSLGSFFPSIADELWDILDKKLGDLSVKISLAECPLLAESGLIKVNRKQVSCRQTGPSYYDKIMIEICHKGRSFRIDGIYGTPKTF